MFCIAFIKTTNVKPNLTCVLYSQFFIHRLFAVCLRVGPIIQILDENYHDKWIGRGSPTPYPSRSPDNPLKPRVVGFREEAVHGGPFPWPSRSSDLILLTSTMRGFMKDAAHVCPMPKSLEVLKI